MGAPVVVNIDARPQPERRERTITVAFSAGDITVRAHSVGEAVGAARAELIRRDPWCGRMATYFGAREG